MALRRQLIQRFDREKSDGGRLRGCSDHDGPPARRDRCRETVDAFGSVPGGSCSSQGRPRGSLIASFRAGGLQHRHSPDGPEKAFEIEVRVSLLH